MLVRIDRVNLARVAVSRTVVIEGGVPDETSRRPPGLALAVVERGILGFTRVVLLALGR